MTTSDPDDRERLGKLEATILSVRDELAGLRGAIAGVQSSISTSRETNWATVAAWLALAGALYAAAIRPISNDISRQETAAQALAEAVIEQNKTIKEMRVQQSINLQRIDELHDILGQVMIVQVRR